MVLAGCALLLPAIAPASPLVGIADEHPQMFASPYFRALRAPISRLIVSYDVAVKPSAERREVDAWMNAAYAAGIQPLVSFNYVRGCYTSSGRIPHLSKCRAPSVGAFRRAFRAFRARYPLVHDYSPWNEANHHSEPTYKDPRLAAQFYDVVRGGCARCTIVAADVLDQAGVVQYLQAFRRYTRGNPRIWGLHNYQDTNNSTDRRTRSVLAAVRGEVWLTETGGIVKFLHNPFSPRRAARAVKFMFHVANVSPRITRLYVYQWTAARRHDRFDAGITGPSGAPRPAYFIVKRYLKQHPRKLPAPPAGRCPVMTHQGCV